MTKLLLLWLAAVPLMGSPGPATISLAGIGTGYGFRKGLPYLIGIITGTTGVLVMIATGVTVAILANPTLTKLLTLLAASYIVYLAWKIASAPVGLTQKSKTAAPSFVSGLTLAIANPKAFAAIGAVYSGHTLVTDNLINDSLAKIFALTFVIALVNSLWLLFGSAFSQVLTSPKSGRIANIVFALMLLGSVMVALMLS